MRLTIQSLDTGAVYRIVVRGGLSRRYTAASEEMEMEARNRQTSLTVEVSDQARLHGILRRIADLWGYRSRACTFCRKMTTRTLVSSVTRGSALPCVLVFLGSAGAAPVQTGEDRRMGSSTPLGVMCSIH